MINSNLMEESSIRKIIAKKGVFNVFEYDHDISVSPSSAETAYFASKMNIRKRQIVCELNGGGVVVQAGAMQMMVGNVNAATDIRGASDFLKKAVGSKVTGETAVKPKYEGNGILVLEPTYKHILLEDLSDWDNNMVIEDGLFLACDDSVNMSVVARSNVSSAVLGKEGLFNSMLSGKGIVALESPVPVQELLVFNLQNDVLKIDGNMAIAWSNSLAFTVEKTTKSLIGSAASGEGFVNVYRGTGKVLVAPVC